MRCPETMSDPKVLYLQFCTRNNILVHTFSSWMGLIAAVLFSRSSPTFPQSWSSDLTSSHLHPTIVSTKTRGWQAQTLRWSSYFFSTTIFFFLPFLSSFHFASILYACTSASHQSDLIPVSSYTHGEQTVYELRKWNEMKKWLSQWMQFMQLRKRSLKKIQDLNGFKPRWSPEFFLGFFRQLHKLRSLRRSFLHFHVLVLMGKISDQQCFERIGDRNGIIWILIFMIPVVFASMIHNSRKN